MSNLEELIEKLCPDGVEYKTIRDICKKIASGGTPTASKSEYYNGYIPWLRTQEVDWKDILDTEIKITELGYNNSSTKWIPKNCVIVAMYGATAAKVAINKIPLTTNQACCNLEIDERIAEYKYVYYWLCKEYINLKSLGQGSQHNINANIIKNYKLPVPPLEVQREIVRILDNFTFLTTELAAELAARQKQYEYYRDKLLTPKAEIKTVELGEVCTFVRGPFGGALKKEIFKPHGYAVYEQQHAIYRTLDFRYFIDKKKFDELKRFSIKPGDMIVSCSGTIGKTFIIPEDAPEGVINQALLKLTPHDELNVFYLQYFFENTISKELNGVARGGAIKNVPSVSELKAIKIPVPSLDVQERLVQVLDNFDAICSDLNIGLPAEIEARQKQYEYYRDKLLTFKELKKEA